mgnify:CR=1 FL=1
MLVRGTAVLILVLLEAEMNQQHKQHEDMVLFCWMLGIALLLLFMPTLAHAHGTRIEYVANEAVVVTITAAYDSGTPMREAQVIVYTPTDPVNAWLTGTTDQAGVFQFVPDLAQAGRWEVVVRQAGHGGTVYVPISADMASGTATVQARGSSNPMSPLQTALMGASVVWGFVGTAFYFSRRRTT